MQFEYPAIVLGASRMLVEGRPYAFVFVGSQPEPDRENDVRGFSIRKMPADPAVFDMLTDVEYGKPIQKNLLMILKQAAGGKSQPHVVGVVPTKVQQQAAPAGQANKATS